MAEPGPAGQTGEQEGNAQAVEAGTGNLGAIRDAARLCRDGVRKAKDQLEMDLARGAKNNKKGFYRYINQKNKIQEGIASLVSNTTR